MAHVGRHCNQGIIVHYIQIVSAQQMGTYCVGYVGIRHQDFTMVYFPARGARYFSIYTFSLQAQGVSYVMKHCPLYMNLLLHRVSLKLCI